MKETGILFTAESVRAMQEGRKTMTRRTYGLEKINENPDDWKQLSHPEAGISFNSARTGTAPKEVDMRDLWTFRNLKTGDILTIKCPYGQAGDLLYVKEAFAVSNDGEQVLHKASYENIVEALDLHNFAEQQGLPPLNIKWRTPLFMPKKYARIWREITGLRAERLQEITEGDAKAEGIAMSKLGTRFMFSFTGKAWVNSFADAYRSLWDSLNIKKYPWSMNPWVWPISYKEIGRECLT